MNKKESHKVPPPFKELFATDYFWGGRVNSHKICGN